MRQVILLSMAVVGFVGRAEAASINVADIPGSLSTVTGAELAGADATVTGAELDSASLADAAPTLNEAKVALPPAATSLRGLDTTIYAAPGAFDIPLTSYSPAPVPEPSTLPLVAAGLAALAFLRPDGRHAARVKAA